MRASIIKIGNSRGVRIPKLFLEESGLKNDVELRVKKGEIRILAIKPKKSRLKINDEYILSLNTLKDWDTPQEDKAWANLQ